MEPDNDVTAIEMDLLLQAIHARYGYDLRDYTPASMRRRLLATLAKSGLRNLGELQHEMLVDQEFFAEVLEGLMVRVSEMFRDPSFYRAFRIRVVPVLRTYPLLKIWHAGCATGEEVYSSAILLSEERLYERSLIYATDLSSRALEQAKQGIYSTEHLGTFAHNYAESGGTSDFSHYYTAAYDRIAIKDSLRRNISFFQHNLVSDYVLGEMHVIFCRNVLIYFDQDLRERVVHKFAQSICSGGFLCLGLSERLSRSSLDETFSEFAAQERIYRHEG